MADWPQILIDFTMVTAGTHTDGSMPLVFIIFFLLLLFYSTTDPKDKLASIPSQCEQRYAFIGSLA